MGLNGVTLQKCPQLRCLQLQAFVTTIELYENARILTQTHITSYSHPGKIHTHVHTWGVNVKASTLQGPSKPQIHLCPDSSPPLATHTHKNVVAEHTYTELC